MGDFEVVIYKGDVGEGDAVLGGEPVCLVNVAKYAELGFDLEDAGAEGI